MCKQASLQSQVNSEPQERRDTAFAARRKSADDILQPLQEEVGEAVPKLFSSHHVRSSSASPASSKSEEAESAPAGSRPEPDTSKSNAPCSVGEKVCAHTCTCYVTCGGVQVMVDMANGFKIGVIKYLGETEFGVGEWVGVALDRPFGEPAGRAGMRAC